MGIRYTINNSVADFSCAPSGACLEAFMTDTLKLPVGIDNFEKIRKSDFYYVDKTKLIEQVLQNWGEVNLFTRPRRFGKTLNMSMLRSFFEIGTDPRLFDGLYISKNQSLCEQYMGKYPVIFLSLKDVDGLSYEEAFEAFAQIVGNEINRVAFLKESDCLTEEEREQFKGLCLVKDGKYAFDKGKLTSSLKILSQLLYKHYEQKVIILIDEYDVPLDKAFQNGYYKEMVSLIRGMFGQALKTNEYLQFAVLTGCLRVSKESIFTGLNNFKVLSIADTRFDEAFGFTDDEVKQLVAYYGLTAHFDEVKEWYDGYHFGNADVYCPWDVINHVDNLRANEDAKPQAYWINSSSNSFVKRLIHIADLTTKDEIERLIAGEAVEKVVRLELTYDEIDNSIDNIWSVLFTTGYLTKTGEVKLPDSESYAYRLVIPNKEVREVFILQIQEWFKNVVAKEAGSMQLLSRAFMEADVEAIQRQLNIIMTKMISILDTKARDEQKENFYHGLLLGLLRGSNPDWLIKSNSESGDGFSDIIIKPENPDAGIVIEVKYARTFQGLDKACDEAVEQIENLRYDEALREEGRCDILAYGIAFHKKRCKVVMLEK